MLIKHAASTIEKLDALGGMAKDDILSRPKPSSKSRQPYTLQARNTLPGVYRAAMPNGKFISLMRVMFTDFCKYDCHYCPNSTWVPRKRYGLRSMSWPTPSWSSIAGTRWPACFSVPALPVIAPRPWSEW